MNSPNNISLRLPTDDIVDLLKSHCILTSEEIDAIALWITASYLINSFRVFPKLALISPEKRCGKSTTMEVIQSVAKKGVLLSSISSAGLYRVTQQGQPCLLIDEADTFVKDGSPDLVGIINSSHSKKGSTVIRCAGDDHQTKEFNTWMPMVFASIGALPDTIMDRSLAINLRRKKQQETVARIPVDLEDQQLTTRDTLDFWCVSIEAAILNSSVVVPQLGNDRAQDNWFPLYAVADALGGSWPTRCEAAYTALTVATELELPTMLLMSIKDYFESSGNSKVSSAGLVDELCKDATGPWLECNNSKRVSQNQIARLLRNYGIIPRSLRFGDSVIRGYELTDFQDTFQRYLP